jgi:hypothetical protein
LLGVISGQAPDMWMPLEAQPFVRYFDPFDSLGYDSGVDYQAPFTHQDALFWLWVVARVPPGQAYAAVSAWRSAFQTDLQLFARFTPPEDRKPVLAARFELEPAARSESALIEKYSEPLVELMAMCALILLISCVNLAGLQHTRLLARGRPNIGRERQSWGVFRDSGAFCLDLSGRCCFRGRGYGQTGSILAS